MGEKTGAAAIPAKVQLGIILILLLVYFLQVASPLRLHPDTVYILTAAANAEQGHGFLYHGQPTMHPPGYLAMVALLIHLHLAHPWVLIAVNMVFLTFGLAAARRIVVSEFAGGLPVFLVCLLSLLSFVFIKYSAIPLTDTVYFGVSMACLLAMKSGSSASFDWRRVSVAAVLLLASICVRRVGIALIPALLYMMLFQLDLRLYVQRLSTRMKVGAIVFAATAATALAWVIRNTSTLRDFHRDLRGYTVIEAARGILGFRLKELGEMALNLPFNAFPPIVQNAIPFLGALVFLLVFGGIAARRRQFSVVEVYFVSYVAILLIWTGYDPRYWLPVIPLLIMYCGMSLGRFLERGIARHLVTGYVFLFIAAGILTLTLNTTLSYSGRRFADLYPEYHATYCAAWHCNEGFDPAKVNPDALQVLREYR
jgi:hypothetical protein